MLCPWCGKDHDRRKWCSDACKMEAYKDNKRARNKEKLDSDLGVCRACNKQFRRLRSSQLFCGDRCKKDWFKSKEREDTTKRRKQVVKICPTCQSPFSPEKTLKEKYCSKRCAYLFPKKCYKALRTCLSYINGDKSDKTHKLLGYTPRQLQDHIQAHPNWTQVKDGPWHLDHVFPIIAFLEKGIKDVAVICCLANLQPLSPTDNHKKNDSYKLQDFENWLESLDFLDA